MSTLTYAAGILQAWGGSDWEGLKASLAGAAAMEATGATGATGAADEIERAELLSGIAGEMQDMLASGRTEGAAVCLKLLRHLACRQAY